MKNLWWAACDKDDLIINEMHAYVHAKMKKRWYWCCCKREQDTCEISVNKRSKKGGSGSMVVVSVVSHTEIKEWLHYYALCAIATHHGAQLLLSL